MPEPCGEAFPQGIGTEHAATKVLYEFHGEARRRAQSLDIKHDGDVSPPRRGSARSRHLA